jgi:hypothetical protein
MAKYATGKDPLFFVGSLDLSRQYRIPMTLYISTRLLFCKDEALDYIRRFHIDFDLRLIAAAAPFLRDNLSFRDEIDYPLDSNAGKTPVQLGNHMFLHYSNAAGACSENDWSVSVRPGQFRYRWEKTNPAAKTSLSEQYENCVKNEKILARHLDAIPKSWSAPYNNNDEHTALSIERAGVAAASAADQRFCHKKGTTFPRIRGICTPYHPTGCSTLVETGFQPGDPVSSLDVLETKLAICLAILKRSQVTHLTHHHLGRHISLQAPKLFEEILDFAVRRASLIWLTTHYSIARYWEDVFCPIHRRIHMHIDQGSNTCVVENTGDHPIEGIPIEIEFSENVKTMLILDFQPKTKVQIPIVRNTKQTVHMKDEFGPVDL